MKFIKEVLIDFMKEIFNAMGYAIIILGLVITVDQIIVKHNFFGAFMSSMIAGHQVYLIVKGMKKSE